MTKRHPIEFVASRLEQHGCRPRRRGDDLRSLCPVHSGNSRALHISLNERGDLLITCHHGCDTELILSELGLAWSELFAENNPRTRRANPQGEDSPAQARKPCPWSLGSSQRPELYDLLDAYAHGELRPEPVQLGELPKRAGDDDRRVAADIALLIGLRRADGEKRPLPYSERFCAARMGWERERARRVLRRLVRWGVLDRAGEMQRRPDMPRGTMTYTAPSAVSVAPRDVALVAGDESLDQSQVVEEGVGLDPAIEHQEQLAVEGAEVASVPPARTVGMVASRNGAGALGNGRHVEDDNSQIGYDTRSVAELSDEELLAAFPGSEIEHKGDDHSTQARL